MAYDPAIGQRAPGQGASTKRRFYFCAVCGFIFPEDQTIIPEAPLPHAGLRICTRGTCNDEPSYDYYSLVTPYRPTGAEFEP